ncbi:MAG: carboxypeptidase regulatory-like domain-containing protein [Verrucomicrobia bacterium]|nr:carboxypeptidase regulatory-like domain-containing protein [Verrucomicrobiota bacterium]
MKRLWVLLWVAHLALVPTRAGTIHGIVRAQAPPELARDASGSGGAYESRKFKFAERVDYAQLRDFIVFIDQPMTNRPAPPAKPVRIITQKDAIFKPHALPVLAGTTIEWPNEDSIFHNVFSMSAGNDFDLGLYKTPGTNGWPKIILQKPGRVDVFCSIHTKMNCVILVLENPFFAATDSRGRYTMTNVPPGEYTLKAWHERLPPRTQKITVSETGEVKADFTLGPQAAPKPK